MTDALYAFIVGFVVCFTVAYLWYRQQMKNDATEQHSDEHIG